MMKIMYEPPKMQVIDFDKPVFTGDPEQGPEQEFQVVMSLRNGVSDQFPTDYD